MRAHLLYTVYCDRHGYPVRYLNCQTGHSCWFVGPFRDPGAASQEFCAWAGPRVWREYLPPAQFVTRACALIGQHRQARAALQRWQALSTGPQSLHEHTARPAPSDPERVHLVFDAPNGLRYDTGLHDFVEADGTLASAQRVADTWAVSIEQIEHDRSRRLHWQQSHQEDSPDEKLR